MDHSWRSHGPRLRPHVSFGLHLGAPYSGGDATDVHVALRFPALWSDRGLVLARMWGKSLAG